MALPCVSQKGGEWETMRGGKFERARPTPPRCVIKLHSLPAKVPSVGLLRNTQDGVCHLCLSEATGGKHEMQRESNIRLHVVSALEAVLMTSNQLVM